ncbi:MFS transporter [Rhodococcus koreensis]|uniref:MFS transporter n=1 Tax=Rhodococcus koreensis TaxID=99653 RepID=UPI00197CE66F|nr:MFS transporter [Rhodococcus koreensis]QSE84908.1 MFS transporter [Rhodococcus koreensis]
MTATKTATRTGVLDAVHATPPPVRYLLGGVLVNQVGAFVQTFLLLYLMHRDFSIGAAGIALTTYSAGSVLGTLLGGELTHRIGPRATIVAAMTTSGLILGAVPLLSRSDLYLALLMAIALAGLATQCYRPAAAVLLSDLMPDEHRVMAFSMMRTALNIGAALGPLIAAGLILVDWNLLFWFDALTALVYAAVARILLPSVRAARETEEPAPDRRSAYAILLRDWRYLLFLASCLIGTVIYVQYTVALPLQITAAGHPTALYSAVLMTASLVLIACELKITSHVTKLRPNTVGAVGTAVMGLGVAAYGLATHSSAAILACTVVFVFGVMINGPTMFAHPAKSPAAVKARYIGAHQATFGLGMALGPALGVLAWETMSTGMWALCGVLGIAAAWCALVGMREESPS